jgi:hypothetical protein
MKPLSILFFFCFSILSPIKNPAQTRVGKDSSKKDTSAQMNRAEGKGQGVSQNHPVEDPDDEFNIFLLALGAAFCSAILGAAVVGSFMAALVLLCIFALVTGGILSVSVLTGLYRRSFAAGFKTFLIIVCCIGCVVAGVPGFWLINRIFSLHLASPSAAWIGLAAGLISGLLLALCLYGIFRAFAAYFKKRLAL